MTGTAAPETSARWTCPFCLLLCDGARLRVAGDRLELDGDACAEARRLLPRFSGRPSSAGATIDGRPVPLADALAGAAAVLRAARQPLFGGLGTDVAGARALYRLAAETGAICDAARGAPLMQGLRVLQDRGGFTTTLGEVRSRCDLFVALGGLPLDQASNLFERLGFETDLVAARRLVVVGPTDADEADLQRLAGVPGLVIERVDLHGDLHATVALLAALVAGRQVVAPPPALAALAQQLRGAQYAVLSASTGRLGAQGALLLEAANRIVAELNRHTRAASLWLGGGNGASTVNQVFAWLSGLPLRSRAGPLGLEHEPVAFDAVRLLADGAVDALLWLSSFDPDSVPPVSGLPRIVIGHPELGAASGHEPAATTIFIPVATPGIGSPGHLFRADGVVLMPLVPVYRDTLPTAAEVLTQLARAVAEPST